MPVEYAPVNYLPVDNYLGTSSPRSTKRLHCIDVPKTQSGIIGYRRQAAAIGIPNESVDSLSVPRQNRYSLPISRFPKPNLAILAPRCENLPIGRPSNSIDCLCIRLDRIEHTTRGNVPDKYFTAFTG